MAPALLARCAVPATSRALARAPRAVAAIRVRFNSTDAPVDLNAVAAKARVVKTLPDFSMANKVCHTPPRATLRPRSLYLPPLQVAVVTGAARGLGNEFCRAFVQSGCTSLAIVDLKEDEAEAAAAELVKAACGQYHSSSSPFPALSPSAAPIFPPSTALCQRHFADKV